MIVLALGSNLGDRADFLARARGMLEQSGVRILRASREIETPALLPEGAPVEWNIAFLNQVLVVETAQAPHALLRTTQHIERALGRQDRGRWGPREVDVDIICYHDEILNDTALTLPHAQMHRRDFVLLPLAEIAPEWRYPAPGHWHGMRAAELLKVLP